MLRSSLLHTVALACAVFGHRALAAETAAPLPSTWTADNGNGTYSNPLFYDEFSDPDLIRVGHDFYLTGTTMHTMPGLPVLHSTDLVNWRLLTYASPRLDLGPEFRLEDGKEIYGQGIWAPSFRHHDGTFYIFTNVNRHRTQVFRAKDPAGPWTRTAMKCSLHDLSVLFDDDGRAYAIWGYQEIHYAQLNDELTDLVHGTEKIIIPKGAGIGEGVHWYKLDGKYYILSAWFDGRMRMPAARADRREGPYEVNLAISTDEEFGLGEGYRMWKTTPPYAPIPPNPNGTGRLAMHQGGIVDTPTGEWWGFSMMDANSIGRLTCLSPITWQDGWPYFGLPGNLRRSPRTWTKPNVGRSAQASPPSAPYQRNDAFDGPQLANVWQWNHAPVDAKWSLTERAGFLRLHALPAADFWSARNSLTQRAIGPRSNPVAELDVAGLEPGDVAGLALLNLPYAWIGVVREGDRRILRQFDQLRGKSTDVALPADRLWLRADCDFLEERATFSYSTDGKTFTPFGTELRTVFQLKTFQGVRYALFHYNTGGSDGGHADFASFHVEEPHPRGLMRAIPYGRKITLRSHGEAKPLTVDGEPVFTVIDAGLGRATLHAGDRVLTVDATAPGATVALTLTEKSTEPAAQFQWTETFYGDLNLLSLASQRLVRWDAATGKLFADSAGSHPNRKDGSCLVWELAAE